jgi:hypothetical protein
MKCQPPLRNPRKSRSPSSKIGETPPQTIYHGRILVAPPHAVDQGVVLIRDRQPRMLLALDMSIAIGKLDRAQLAPPTFPSRGLNRIGRESGR